MRTIPLERARRIALGAQGFSGPRPEGRIDVRHLRRVLAINHVVQLDSVNVAARAHYVPFFSRLGPYDRERLDDWLWRSGENFEYPGHEASVLPLPVYPLMGYRRAAGHRWRGVRRLAEERPGYIEQVYAAVAADGPLTAGDLAEPGDRGGSWWGWTPGRIALEWLYHSGQLAIAERDASFTLHYDLTERVIPAAVLDQPTPPREQAVRELLRLASRAHGIGTAKDLADHFRIKVTEARPLLAVLVAAGELEEVAVRGWQQRAYVHPDVVTPRRIDAAALLSPFDPVVWFRERAERLFDFHYRIEIYVPESKREYGYYVLPFLLDDRLVARVDLKADRRARRLLVPGAYSQPGEDVSRVARELAAELRRYAAWLGLVDVEVGDRGDLAVPLHASL